MNNGRPSFLSPLFSIVPRLELGKMKKKRKIIIYSRSLSLGIKFVFVVAVCTYSIISGGVIVDPPVADYFIANSKIEIIDVEQTQCVCVMHNTHLAKRKKEKKKTAPTN